jgi:hypothetical protein
MASGKWVRMDLIKVCSGIVFMRHKDVNISNLHRAIKITLRELFCNEHKKLLVLQSMCTRQFEGCDRGQELYGWLNICYITVRSCTILLMQINERVFVIIGPRY